MLHRSDHPLIRAKVTQLRAADTGPKRFRELVRELATLLGYEATRDLGLAPRTVHTPLAEAAGWGLAATVGLVPILRAGLGMVDGILELIPGAVVWHLGLYRDEETLRPVEYYSRLSGGDGARVADLSLVLDPMLATGGSAVAAIDLVKRAGGSRIKYLGLIAAPEGIAALTAAHPDVALHVAAVDDHLDERGYIVPGQGDAGDRQFGI